MFTQNGHKKQMIKSNYIFLFFIILLNSCMNNNKIGLNENIVIIENKDSTKGKNIKIDTIIDSNYSISNIFIGKSIPSNIKENLQLISVYYIGYDSLIHKGQIVVNKKISNDVKQIFDSLYLVKFPIEKVIPINHYRWNDEQSMADNNTSSFNYRTVKNSNKLSVHSYGLAIDINPRENPYITRSGKIFPSNGNYDINNLGTINESSSCFKIFKSFGWKWGGNWIYSKDYQHFSINGK